MVLDDVAVACRDRVFQPAANAISNVMGLSPFKVARCLLYVALGTVLVALADHMVTHGPGAPYAVPCGVVAAVAIGQAYLLTEELRRFERSISVATDHVVHHRFRNDTTLLFCVCILCVSAAAWIAGGALTGPGTMPVASLAGELACVGASAMLLPCAWHRPRARSTRFRFAHHAG